MPTCDISAIHHYAYKHGGLEVTFQSGKTYRYEVPWQVYYSLHISASKGKHYNAQIKSKYPCREVPLHRAVEIAFRAYSLITGDPLHIPCIEFCGEVIVVGRMIFGDGADNAAEYFLKLAEQRLAR